MQPETYKLESTVPFSESIIWQLNRNFYQSSGIDAWSNDIVPHHMTSNSAVGKTYAEMIFGMLKDLAEQGFHEETLYILELGAGHGRLAFHVLKHLDMLVKSTKTNLAPYCYILSDIIEDSLIFFEKHKQFKPFLERGVLDIAYFDAMKSESLVLRISQNTISKQSLTQPLVTIGNYFFDSIPCELLYINDKKVSTCVVTTVSEEKPPRNYEETKLDSLSFSYYNMQAENPLYKESEFNTLVEKYRNSLANTYLFFPKNSMQCLKHLQQFSQAGMMLLTMDKGFHELDQLDNKSKPEIITHGSFSVWVNYHALGAYCESQGGKALFPQQSNFHLEIGCLMFMPDNETFTEIHTAYHQFIDNFGPDDFNSIKQLAYNNLARLQVVEILALLRLSSYDSTFFIKLLPRLKQVFLNITIQERRRIAEMLDSTWNMYFNINDPFDLAYEMGGMLYDLGYYHKALLYFQNSIDFYGEKADVMYNQALSYYQLKQDNAFYICLARAKKMYPEDPMIKSLENLDMS